jgi:uncharacterized membrane protein
LQIANWWYISVGALKKSYYLSVAIYILVATVDTSVAIIEPNQIGILMFDIVNFWAIIMSIKGILRLKEIENGNVK